MSEQRHDGVTEKTVFIAFGFKFDLRDEVVTLQGVYVGVIIARALVQRPNRGTDHVYTVRTARETRNWYEFELERRACR